jgi:hypothetical protein
VLFILLREVRRFNFSIIVIEVVFPIAFVLDFIPFQSWRFSLSMCVIKIDCSICGISRGVGTPYRLFYLCGFLYMYIYAFRYASNAMHNYMTLV